MNAQEIATSNWPDIVHEIMPAFSRIALQTKSVTWEQESQFAIQALQKNQRLAECSAHTVQNAVINIAAVGLTLNPADGYAYLVPEYNNQAKANECQLRISFKGLVKIATDTGAIKWVKAEIVKTNDTFVYKGVNQEPTHEMTPFGDRGDTIGVYCIAKTVDGEYLVDTMPMSEIIQIKGCAKTQMVWDKWPDEMAKKAVIKRAAKQWPKTASSSALHKAIEVINDSEGSDFDDFANLEKIADAILMGIDNDDKMEVGEVWEETTDSEKDYLWKAKTKGGFFSQDEKVFIRDSITAFRKANEPAIEGELDEGNNSKQ